MLKSIAIFLAVLGSLAAQTPNPTQRPAGVYTPAQTGQPMPIFRVTVVSRTTTAINYHHRTGSTQVDLRGTELMPPAKGEARVESRMGSTKIETRYDKMTPASQFGPEYMTYVLWAITPEGRPKNLGEVVLDGDHSSLLSTTDLQAFALIVTAEPYFAVTQPSNVVVMENFVRDDTTGSMQPVAAKYELLPRGEYVVDRGRYQAVKVDRKGPLQLAEAQNAVEIARLAGAERYAADTMAKATQELQNAEAFLNSKNKDRKRSETSAREATQMAEDARIITFRRIREEQAAAQRAATEQAQADAARATAQARAEEERRRLAEQERAAAQQARSEAEDAARRAAAERAAADAARAAAQQQQQALAADADRARLAAEQAQREKAELHDRLLQQLNSVLETRETQRGLIVNMSDVLFDTGRYTLKPGAREKLAKVSGILLAYPGLRVQVEGHTDSVGGDDYNQHLSENRAAAVRDFLVQQGVASGAVSAAGFGKANPVASNDTAAGRQQNRRVELVVSGGVTGTGTTMSTLDRR